VVYEPPQVVAGEPPVRTTCTPPSGSTFQLGTTTVACNTRDSVGRTSTCSFTVTVGTPPHLSATSFMAFGNSITEGKNGSGVIVDDPYPEILQQMLAARYVTQSITVANRGLGGEQTGTGSDRIKSELAALHPEVVLLEEGVNDLLAGDPTRIGPMIEALADIVHKSKASGATVFLATLLPTRPGSPRGDGPAPLIPEANRQIRALASAEHVPLVDLYLGVNGSTEPYIDIDGLHPNQVGYQKMAQVFFDSIRGTLEMPTGVVLGTFVRNMPAQTPFSDR
jgi:lysophospholipase L1-like esterase